MKNYIVGDIGTAESLYNYHCMEASKHMAMFENVGEIVQTDRNRDGLIYTIVKAVNFPYYFSIVYMKYIIGEGYIVGREIVDGDVNDY